MKKEVKNRRVTRIESIEIVLAVAVTILLSTTLFSEKYNLNIPHILTSSLLLIFVLIKGFNTTIRKDNIIEDYLALSLIIIFGIMQFTLSGKINPIVTISAILVLLYSIGMVIWVKSLFRSKNVFSFVISYAIFVVVVIILFAGTYFENNSDFTLNNSPTQIDFEEAIYFSTITFTTLGYGDIAPIGINRLIATIQAIIGAILNIAFMGYILASKRFEIKSNEEEKNRPIVLLPRKQGSKK
jgi:hypothetical protein